MNNCMPDYSGRRRVGRMGESILRHWCAEIGITCNRVEEDDTGWDGLLEFPLPIPAKGQALDKMPPSPTVRIQVKSTDGKSQRVRMRLSNWLRLVDAADPAFVLALEFDGKSSCQRAYLVHVGDALIRRVLKRLRELSSSGGGVALSKRDMTVGYGEADRMPSLTGEGLLTSIQFHLGSDLSRYRLHKHQLRETAGYEEQAAQLTANIIVPEDYVEDPEEMMVDFDLGILPSLKVTTVKAWDTRFGIRTPKPTIELSEGGELRTSRNQPLRTVQLQLRALRSQRAIRVPARVWTPTGVAAVIKESSVKYRLVFPGGHLVLAPYKKGSSISLELPEFDAERPLSELADAATAFRFFIETAKSGETVEFSVNGVRLGELSVLDPMKVPNWLPWCEVMSSARDVLYELGLDLGSTVTPSKLLSEGRALAIARAIVRNDFAGVRINFTLATSNDEIVGHLIHYPLAYRLDIGDDRIFLSAAAVGKIQKESGDGAYQMHPEEAAVVWKTVIGRQAEGQPTKTDLLEDVRIRVPRGALVVRWWTESPCVEERS